MTSAIVIKPSKDAKLGIGLTTFTDGTVRISSIAKDGLFAETDLQVGMVVEAINGNTKFSTSKEAISLLKEAEGLVVIRAPLTEVQAIQMHLDDNVSPQRSSIRYPPETLSPLQMIATGAMSSLHFVRLRVTK